MEFQALGNIGEFVGAIAVVVSLLFLAFQVRENSRAVRFDSELKMRSFHSEGQKVMLGEDIVKVYQAGIRNLSALSEVDRARFNNLMFLRLNPLDVESMGRGLLDEDNVSGITGTSYYAKRPGFQEWWLFGRNHFSAPFVERFDAEIAEAKAQAIDAQNKRNVDENTDEE